MEAATENIEYELFLCERLLASGEEMRKEIDDKYCNDLIDYMICLLIREQERLKEKQAINNKEEK